MALLGALLAGVAPPAGAGEPPARDQRGAPLPASLPAHKMVTFNSALWMLLTLDQGTDRVAGASASTVRVVTTGLLGKAFPQAARVPDTVAADGFFLPNVEAILALAPDAVLQWVGRNDPAYLAPLERAGLPVVGLRENQSDADYIATARLLGTLSGQPGRAEALVERYQALYAALARDLASLVGERRPKVLYLWKDRPLIPIGGGSFYGALLERSGGENAAASLSRWGAVTMEQILVWNPDVVLLFCCGPARPQALYEDPAWRAVRAVRERRVYKVPMGGSRFADLIEGPLFSRWLAELLHPGLPSRLRQDLRETYRAIYGLTLSDDDLDRTLHARANALSAHYKRFLRETPP
ncbi:ABC transporter substrate-binding protein [Pararhodospirillum oryzae]|uniref:Iron(III) dicitrate-binding protein n=1 Tax=Pararhodospirillum oryzae TaxID=478448 RepID=A0A512HBN9_9PROT|nr:ABC transporter substrate-binding protein [Pararhodospirillum oryzae]GEO82866.1 iron(III) dicitrate-binding protein [Pararhodospirillum oryzae]